jgi:hypothetical protein
MPRKAAEGTANNIPQNYNTQTGVFVDHWVNKVINFLRKFRMHATIFPVLKISPWYFLEWRSNRDIGIGLFGTVALEENVEWIPFREILKHRYINSYQPARLIFI